MIVLMAHYVSLVHGLHNTSNPEIALVCYAPLIYHEKSWTLQNKKK